MVLETTFMTTTGSVTVTDALALGANERGHDLGASAPSFRAAGAARANLEVGLPAAEGGRMQLVPDLDQLETGAEVSGPEGPDEVWHEPGAQRLLKASATVPVSGSMS
jgi:alpha,alpha-trehalase